MVHGLPIPSVMRALGHARLGAYVRGGAAMRLRGSTLALTMWDGIAMSDEAGTWASSSGQGVKSHIWHIVEACG